MKIPPAFSVFINPGKTLVPAIDPHLLSVRQFSRHFREMLRQKHIAVVRKPVQLRPHGQRRIVQEQLVGGQNQFLCPSLFRISFDLGQTVPVSTARPAKL